MEALKVAANRKERVSSAPQKADRIIGLINPHGKSLSRPCSSWGRSWWVRRGDGNLNIWHPSCGESAWI